MKRSLSIYVAMCFLFLYIPMLVLVVYSFNKDKINSSWGGFTLDWYSRLFHNSGLLKSFLLSLALALLSSLIGTIIGLMAAYSIIKFNFRGKKIFRAVLNLPILTPDLVLGIGLLLFYSLVNFPMGFYSILIAHVTFNIAYSTLIILTRFNYLNSDVENAAINLGASPIQTLRFVVIPIVKPGIIAAFLIQFILSWDDFIISFFTSGVGTTTLPVRIYSMIKMGVSPQINAISTITIAVSLITMLIALRFHRASDILKTT